MRGEFDAFLDLFYYPDPIAHGEIVSPLVSATCNTCEGGTLQTVQCIVPGKIVKYSMINLRGQHTFNVGNWNHTVDTSTSQTVSMFLETNLFAPIEQARSEVTDLIAGVCRRCS